MIKFNKMILIGFSVTTSNWLPDYIIKELEKLYRSKKGVKKDV